MAYKISVVICSHNPSMANLSKVLEALKIQILPTKYWELLLIDNASKCSLPAIVDLTWHNNARHVYEEKLGLLNARLRAFNEAKGDVIVFVDDDNVLNSEFLLNVVDIVEQYPRIGALGGRVLPDFEVEPEKWIRKFDNTLAVRDLGDEVLYCSSLPFFEGNPQYPNCAPVGAGLVLRKQAAKAYVDSISTQPNRLIFGRRGKQLTSGEDNDIVLTILEAGWGVGYFPQLQLLHLISADRLTKDYLSKLNYAASRSWVLVLAIHGIYPWAKISKRSVFLRKVKAFFSYKPWKSDESFVRWKGACGLFEGLAAL